MYISFTGTVSTAANTGLQQLKATALARRREGLRPGTQSNYMSSITLFLQFCAVYNIPFSSPVSQDLAAFTEFLLLGNRQTSTIKNYMSAVRAFNAWWEKDSVLHIFASHNWSLTRRGLTNTVRPTRITRTAVSIEDLSHLMTACDSHSQGPVLKCAISLAFFLYLRISNLAPKAGETFDHTRHSTGGDITETKDGYVFLLKWSKTRQHSHNTQQIPIPDLGDTPSNPLAAWRQYREAIGFFATHKAPLLLHTGPLAGRPVTIQGLRDQFASVLALARLRHKGYMFHSLRRGGASFSFQAGVPLQDIKEHGTWTSEAVHRYLVTSRPFNSTVVRAFTRELHV